MSLNSNLTRNLRNFSAQLHLHLLLSLTTLRNMKWKPFWIKGLWKEKYNTWLNGLDIHYMMPLGNLSTILKMPLKRSRNLKGRGRLFLRREKCNNSGIITRIYFAHVSPDLCHMIWGRSWSIWVLRICQGALICAKEYQFCLSSILSVNPLTQGLSRTNGLINSF